MLDAGDEGELVLTAETPAGDLALVFVRGDSPATRAGLGRVDTRGRVQLAREYQWSNGLQEVAAIAREIGMDVWICSTSTTTRTIQVSGEGSAARSVQEDLRELDVNMLRRHGGVCSESYTRKARFLTRWDQGIGRREREEGTDMTEIQRYLSKRRSFSRTFNARGDSV